DRGHRQWDRHTAGTHDANLQSRLHHQERRSRLWIAQRSLGGQISGRSLARRQCRARSRSDVHARFTAQTSGGYLVAKNTTPVNQRILVIDDNPDIHGDFRKLIGGGPGDAGTLGEVERVQQALDEGRPYAMAFVDMRMPPGWDGLETIEHLWAIDPDVQIVI